MPMYTHRQLTSIARLVRDNDFEEFVNILTDRYNSRIAQLLSNDESQIKVDKIRGSAAELSEILKLISTAEDTLMEMERNDRAKNALIR